ncbi:hypothetical protein Hypma_005407 [Hypsizygus marmoreus]|uniref:HMG box domain-containing protein n=1 Tax=Hypsizygus marmoreus TaxID=39966 RepID=A0A369K4E3_HYPMA|nr:hypothetical protein Hypma_005407 [Hypsizygus marmoreus]
MLSVLRLRLPLRAAARPLFQIHPIQTRGLLTSVVVREPAKKVEAKATKAKTATKAKAKTTTKAKATTKTKAKATTKAKAKPKKAAEKKPKKKEAPKDISRGLKIPGQGPTPFTHFFKQYCAALPKATDPTEFVQRAKDAGAAWRDLPQAEKERIAQDVLPLRAAAREAREEFLRGLEPGVLFALNKRRVLKGKTRLHYTTPEADRRPTNSFVRFTLNYRATNDVSGKTPVEIAKTTGELWRGMSEAEKAPFVAAAQAARAEYDAAHPKEESA